MEFSRFLLFVVLLACYRQASPENTTGENNTSTDSIDKSDCSLLNTSCGPDRICQDGVCIKVNRTITDGGSLNTESTREPKTTLRVLVDTVKWTYTTTRKTDDVVKPTPHSLITGNQEFVITLVGFSLLFINICLVSFCLGRIKRRRLRQQREQRRQTATHSSQASQTGDWGSENVNRRELSDMGTDNFALNGELDAFAREFLFPQVRLPPYDFTSAYHKPRPMTEENESIGESPVDTSNAAQNIDEDPPPYGDLERLQIERRPPSYDEILKTSTNAAEESLGSGQSD